MFLGISFLNNRKIAFAGSLLLVEDPLAAVVLGDQDVCARCDQCLKKTEVPSIIYNTIMTISQISNDSNMSVNCCNQVIANTLLNTNMDNIINHDNKSGIAVFQQSESCKSSFRSELMTRQDNN